MKQQSTAKRVFLAIAITLSPLALALLMSTTTSLTKISSGTVLDLGIYGFLGTIITAVVGALISWANGHIILRVFLVLAILGILLEFFFILNPASYQGTSW